MTMTFGSPGVGPKWTRSSKQGIGTAYHTSCHTLFTLSHGILNELQFLITDGETFCHEEKRDLDHKVEYPEQRALYYHLTNCDRQGRYLIVKEIITDPYASVVSRLRRGEPIVTVSTTYMIRKRSRPQPPTRPPSIPMCRLLSNILVLDTRQSEDVLITNIAFAATE